MTKQRRLQKRGFNQTHSDEPVGTTTRNPPAPIQSGFKRSPEASSGIKRMPEQPIVPGIVSRPETPNYPVDPNRPLTKGQYLDLERAKSVAQFQPGCDLPNPYHAPPFDRTQPLGRIQKREALGFRPASDDILGLRHGDAWNGKRQFRRTQYFSQLVDPSAITDTAFGSVRNFQNGQGIMEAHGEDPQRPRLFQVSLFSIGIRRASTEISFSPLTEQEILANQLVGIQGGPLSQQGGQLFSSISMTRFRLLINDASGGRYWDVDVMGTRTVNIWAMGITAFALIPEGGYEVRTPAGGQPIGPQQQFSGLVEDTIAGARIFPISLEDGDQFKDQVTAQVRVDPDTDPATPLSPTGSVLVPVPPGARELQVYCSAPDFATNAGRLAWNIQFDAGLGLQSTSQGQIVLDPVTGRTPSPIFVPNCNVIALVPGLGNPVNSAFTFVWSVTV